jgi:hypothetical protein
VAQSLKDARDSRATKGERHYARRPDHVPKYRKNKRNGKAIVTLSDGFGQRHYYDNRMDLAGKVAR